MRRTETLKPIWIKFCVMVDITDVVTYDASSVNDQKA